MLLRIVFKGEQGKLDRGTTSYEFDNQELERLKNDFNDYVRSVESRGTTVRGGAYECRKNGTSSMLFLKFEEIAFIG